MNTILYPKNYVVWDLETTGLDPQTAKIVEFASMTVKDGEVVGVKSFLVNHGVDIPKVASDINGITREMCEKDGIHPDQAKAEIGEILFLLGDTRYTITHNGHRFDIPFLQEFLGSELNVLKSRCIDTAAHFKARSLKMARYFNEPYADYVKRVVETRAIGVKYNVKFCCEQLGIDMSKTNLHRAGGDVDLTNEIYKKLCL